MKFRNDINALRAIAVVSVLLFHLKIPFFSGGFSGVDIFYVISGYLMTNIIVSGINNNKFSILSFYAKRIKRIIPALIFLVLLITVACFFLCLPNEFVENSKNAFSSLFFYSNIKYWNNSLGYFNQSSDTNIFLHTWSLSVEWQFYIIYPIIILLFYSFFKNHKLVKIALIVTTCFVAVFSIFLTYESPAASFYLLPSRAWEMMVGGLVVFYKTDYKNKWLVFSSYALIILCSILLNKSMLWPGFYTLIPVFATALIILLNCDDIVFVKTKGIQFLGKISYSLYIWHWPIIVFFLYLGFQHNLVVNLAIVGISILLAFISFKYIENIKSKSSIQIIGILIIISFVIFIFGFKNLNQILFNSETIKISKFEELHANDIDTQMSKRCCFLESVEERQNWKKSFKSKECLRLDSSRPNILLIGDSHAASLSKALKDSLNKMNINLLICTQAGTLPIYQQYPENSLFYYIYNEFIPTNKAIINGVILTGWWMNYPNNNFQLLKRDIYKKILDLKANNIPSIFIGQNETYTIPFPTIAARDYQYKINSSNLYISTISSEVNVFLRTGLKNNYVDIYNCCPAKVRNVNELYMFDNDHFSTFGAKMIIHKILIDSTTIKFLKKYTKLK